MNEFITKCKNIVINYVGDKNISKDDVFVVWSCKTLQNKKSIIKCRF